MVSPLVMETRLTKISIGAKTKANKALSPVVHKMKGFS